VLEDEGEEEERRRGRRLGEERRREEGRGEAEGAAKLTQIHSPPVALLLALPGRQVETPS
jgi:hypothetical protein